MSDYVHVSLNEHTLNIQLRRAHKKNAFTEAMYLAATEALLQGANNPDVHSILFDADGDFSAGNDLQDFLEHPPTSEAAAVFQFMFALSHCPVPVVAAVSGVAIGIGTTLLLHCDFAYAADDTVFSLPFIKLALLPEFGSSMLLPQRAGYHKAAELLLLGDTFDTQTALEANIITAHYPAAAVTKKAWETCARFANTPREVLIQTKTLLKRESEPLDARIRHESAEFMKALQSDDAKAVFKAMLNK